MLSWAFAKYLKYCQFIENTDLLPDVKSLANNYVIFLCAQQGYYITTEHS